MERNTQTGKLFGELMRERESVRVYEDRPIPEEILKDILTTGINAATGGNLQPYSILVIKDKARKEELARMSWGQPHIANAAVNLVFLIDWNKYRTYAAKTDAPFVANRIFSEFVVALEDMSLAAQTIETAAHMYGIGACYNAALIDAGEAARDLLKNPKYTYPIVSMGLGYPKEGYVPAPRRKHMAFEGMVFEETYPAFTEDKICELFEEKYEGCGYKLSEREESRTKKLAQLKSALLTCYDEDRTEQILQDVEAAGRMNEAQRCFGLFYNAANMQKLSDLLLKDMAEMGIEMR